MQRQRKEAAGAGFGRFAKTGVNPATPGRVEKHTCPVTLMAQPDTALFIDKHRRRINAVGGRPVLRLDAPLLLVGKFDRQVAAAGGATVAAPILNRGNLNAK